LEVPKSVLRLSMDGKARVKIGSFDRGGKSRDGAKAEVKSLLQLLGKLNRPYLTAVEEKLLTLLESEYGRIP
jgi:hypothetical protein